MDHITDRILAGIILDMGDATYSFEMESISQAMTKVYKYDTALRAVSVRRRPPSEAIRT
jgi:glutaminase